MYISLTGNSDNKDVYIKRSYRISNGKTATQIHRKLGKLNELLQQFSDWISVPLSTLRSMQVTLLSKESGYIPSYRRTDLTDDLHKIFGFHTDYEFISNSAMRSIIKNTKTEDSTNRFQRGTGYNQHNYWLVANFYFHKCQTPEYTILSVKSH